MIVTTNQWSVNRGLTVIKFYTFHRMASDEEEVVLCTIKIDAGGVVSIHPDFNRGRKAYIAESNKDYGRGTVEPMYVVISRKIGCIMYMYKKINDSGVVSIHHDFKRGRKAYIAESNKDYGRGTVEPFCVVTSRK